MKNAEALFIKIILAGCIGLLTNACEASSNNGRGEVTFGSDSPATPSFPTPSPSPSDSSSSTQSSSSFSTANNTEITEQVVVLGSSHSSLSLNVSSNKIATKIPESSLVLGIELLGTLGLIILVKKRLRTNDQ
jgi:hypothetical protein